MIEEQFADTSKAISNAKGGGNNHVPLKFYSNGYMFIISVSLSELGLRIGNIFCFIPVKHDFILSFIIINYFD